MKNHINEKSINHNCELGEPFYDEYGFMMGCLVREVSNNFSLQKDLYKSDQQDGIELAKAGNAFLKKEKQKNYNANLVESQFELLSENKIDKNSSWKTSNESSFYEGSLKNFKYDNFYLQFEIYQNVNRLVEFLPGAPICDGSNEGNCNRYSQKTYQKHSATVFLNTRSNQISFASHDNISKKLSTFWFEIEIDKINRRFKLFNDYKFQTLEYQEATENPETFISETKEEKINSFNSISHINLKVFGVTSNVKNRDDLGPYKVLNKIEKGNIYENTSLVSNRNLENNKQLYYLTRSYDHNCFTYTTGKNNLTGDINTYCINHTKGKIHKFRTEFVKNEKLDLACGNLLTRTSSSSEINDNYLNNFQDYDLLVMYINYDQSNLVLSFDNEVENNLFTTFYEEDDAINWLVFQLNDSGYVDLKERWRLLKESDSIYKLDYQNSLVKETFTNDYIFGNANLEKDNQVTVHDVYGFKKTINTDQNIKEVKNKKLSAKERLAKIS